MIDEMFIMQGVSGVDVVAVTGLFATWVFASVPSLEAVRLVLEEKHPALR